jgi:hypothetical protein
MMAGSDRLQALAAARAYKMHPIKQRRAGRLDMASLLSDLS